MASVVRAFLACRLSNVSKPVQNEICAIHNGCFRQGADFVAQIEKCGLKSTELFKCRIEAVSALFILSENFWPWWCEKHSFRIVACAAKRLEVRLASRKLKGYGCIHQTSVKKHQTMPAICGHEVGSCHCDGATGERFHIDPRQSLPRSGCLFGNDASARFGYGGVASGTKRIQQSGFPTARATSDQNEPVGQFSKTFCKANCVRKYSNRRRERKSIKHNPTFSAHAANHRASCHGKSARRAVAWPPMARRLGTVVCHQGHQVRSAAPPTDQIPGLPPKVTDRPLHPPGFVFDRPARGPDQCQCAGATPRRSASVLGFSAARLASR